MDRLWKACAWLDDWRATGAGTTIARDGELFVWWLPQSGELDAQTNRPLLLQLDSEPDLRAAVRAVVHAEAIVKGRK